MFAINFDHATIVEQIWASEGIGDYWIVNIPRRQVEVYREPKNGTYGKVQIFNSGDSVQPAAFPDVSLNPAEMFATLD